MSDPDECPSCGADFQGEPIPDERRHWYGGGMGEWLLMTPGRWVVTARPL
jgi:hypothetical protein